MSMRVAVRGCARCVFAQLSRGPIPRAAFLAVLLCLLPAAVTVSMAAYRLARHLRSGAPVYTEGLSIVNVEVRRCFGPS